MIIALRDFISSGVDEKRGFMVRVLIFITCSLRIIEVSLKNDELRSGFSCCAQTTFRFAQNIPFSLKWLEQCYFENLPRLIKVKTKYDPENLFNFPLGIPTKRGL
jgi:hypothetical protein